MSLLSRWLYGRKSWRDARWVALDCETNGLDAAKDALLSVAWVPIRPPFIDLAESDYGVIQQSQTLNQSAVIHQLSQQHLAEGDAIEAVMKRLAQDTNGTIIVAHHAQFDRTVLSRAMRLCGIDWQPRAWYDTLKAEQKMLARRSIALKPNSLTLSHCRERYGLLSFQGHHARNDAIACAELFLAQTYAGQGRHETNINDVLARGR